MSESEQSDVKGQAELKKWTTNWIPHGLFVELRDGDGNLIDNSFHDMESANAVRDAHNKTLAPSDSSRVKKEEDLPSAKAEPDLKGSQATPDPPVGGVSDTKRLDWLQANVLSGPEPKEIHVLSREVFAVWDAKLDLREAIDAAMSASPVSSVERDETDSGEPGGVA